MDVARNLIEMQAQVKVNAELTKNTLNDLYNWEKEIKDKEKEILSQPDNNKTTEKITLPVRSHIKELDSTKTATNVNDTPTNDVSNLPSPSTEKQDTSLDPGESSHKQANEIKDSGNNHVKKGNYEKAIELYTSAIELFSRDAVFFTNRALCYLKLEKYDECIEDCEQAIEIDSLAVKAYYRRMMANESLGNNMDALKDCTTVLMIDPKNTEAKRSLERINERLRKNASNNNGPNFTPLRSNTVDILPVDKPAYKRSTKPLHRLSIADIVGPANSKNCGYLNISDEDIDKLFNSNCGPFEEIKGPVETKKVQVKAAANNDSKVESEKKLKISQNLDNHKLEVKESDNKIERPLPPAPTSTAQFYSNWKELTTQQKYQYLKSIPVTHLNKILGAGFDSETLSDIIYTLRNFYLLHKDANTGATLLEVSKNKQVFILSLLMSNEERKALSEIINTLNENNTLDTVSTKQIVKNFCIN